MEQNREQRVQSARRLREVLTALLADHLQGETEIILSDVQSRFNSEGVLIQAINTSIGSLYIEHHQHRSLMRLQRGYGEGSLTGALMRFDTQADKVQFDATLLGMLLRELGAKPAKFSGPGWTKPNEKMLNAADQLSGYPGRWRVTPLHVEAMDLEGPDGDVPGQQDASAFEPSESSPSTPHMRA